MEGKQRVSKETLEVNLRELKRQYEEILALNLSLNMARGKPSPAQLDKSMELLQYPKSFTLRDGTDVRNYGILEGIPECREFFGELLDLNPDHIIMGGASSLNLMFDTLASHCLFGTGGSKPWSYYKYEGTNTSGSHKLNTAIAQAYYAKKQGVKGLTTETGAGQWGTALSMSCAYLDMPLKVYMVKVSSEQKPYRKAVMHTYEAQRKS